MAANDILVYAALMESSTAQPNLTTLGPSALVDAVRREHLPGPLIPERCHVCGQIFPCDALRITYEVERLTRQNQTLFNERAGQLQTALSIQRTVVRTLDRFAVAGVILIGAGSLGGGMNMLLPSIDLGLAPLNPIGLFVNGLALLLKSVLLPRITDEPDDLINRGRFAWGVLLITLVTGSLFAA